MSKKITYEEAKKRFVDQGRTDIELIEDGYNGFGNKAKFFDKIQKDYFYSLPKIVYRIKSCHPKRSRQNVVDKLSISHKVAKERFIAQGRTDIELIEYNGWNKKCLFWDNEINEEWWTTPNSVYINGCCHPKKANIKKSELKSISFTEACQRFIEQGRIDIKIIKNEYNGWNKKCLFWDNVIKDYFNATPYYVFKTGYYHPKRYNKRVHNFIDDTTARQRFVHQGRTDIELIDYKGWTEKSKFFDKIQKEYFWASPFTVYNRKSCHPVRSIKNRSVSLREAKERFKEQGRTDLKLITETYVDWTTKAKFWDDIQKDYFYNIPQDVFRNNLCHPKRRRLSKNQLNLLNELDNCFETVQIVSEQKYIINNKKYIVDILLPQYKIIVEYNGDYWHCNPQLYNENYFNTKSKKYAKDVWEYDKQRKKELEMAGYKVLIVWEYDYKNNKKETMEKLKNEIVNIINNKNL